MCQKLVPGGVYCIGRQTLDKIGYFNYLPLGGGDNLFWSEFFGHKHANCCIRLCKRPWVFDEVQKLGKQVNKDILGELDMDVCHFYHGDVCKRSRTQRHFMLLTEFPWKDRILVDDSHNLLSWIDTKHKFYHIAANMGNVDNDKTKASHLIGGNIDYLRFERRIRELQSKRNENMDRFTLVKTIHELIENTQSERRCKSVSKL